MQQKKGILGLIEKISTKYAIYMKEKPFQQEKVLIGMIGIKLSLTDEMLVMPESRQETKSGKIYLWIKKTSLTITRCLQTIGGVLTVGAVGTATYFQLGKKIEPESRMQKNQQPTSLMTKEDLRVLMQKPVQELTGYESVIVLANFRTLDRIRAPAPGADPVGLRKWLVTFTDCYQVSPSHDKVRYCEQVKSLVMDDIDLLSAKEQRQMYIAEHAPKSLIDYFDKRVAELQKTRGPKLFEKV